MSRSSPGWTPLVVGMGLALMDLGLSFRFQGVARPPTWPLRLSILLAVPAALMALSYAVVFLGRFGPFLMGVSLGAWIGHVASVGAHARTMPLANWWGLIAATLGGATAVGMTSARRLTPRRIRLGLALAGLVVTAVAAFTYRGLYVDLRAAAATAGAVLLMGAAWPIAGTSTGPKGRHVILVALVLWLAAWPGLTRAEARSWARRSCTAAAVPVRVLRRFLPRKGTTADRITWSPAPYFATPLRRKVQAALGHGKDRPHGFFLVVVDALRADAVDEKNTPHLLRWGRKGLFARNAHSPSAASHLTLVSALSGLYPNQIAAMADGWNSISLVTERLNTNGVITRAFFPPIIHNLRSPGFRRMDLGFQSLESRDHSLGDPSPGEVAHLLFPSQPDENWFSYLHIMAPHAPYDLGQAPKGATAKQRYLAEVRVADTLVNGVLDELERRGLADSTWVVVTADHGEEFGEHGGVRHSTQLYEESIHVPLVILGPKVRPRTIDTLVSLTDLAPTVDDFFALSSGDRPLYAGRSWAPLALGLDDPGRPTFVLSELPPLESDFLPIKSAVIEGNWKLVVEEQEGEAQLFNLRTDPRETTDLARREPRRLARLWGLSQALRRPGAAVTAAPPRAPAERLPKDLEIFENPDATRHTALLLPTRWGDLPPEHVLRLLALFVRDGDPETALILQVAFTRLAPKQRATTRALLRWILETEEPGDAETLTELYRSTRDAFVQSSLLAAFARRGDDRLLDIPRRPPLNTALVGDLSEAAYRARFGVLPDEDLIAKGRAHTHPWVRRLALEAVAAYSLGNAGMLEDVLTSKTSSPMERIVALRGLARRSRWAPVISATADADREVADEAIGLLFSADPRPPGVRAGRLDEKVTSKALSVDVGPVARGTTVALLLRGTPVLLPRPKIRWRWEGMSGEQGVHRGPHPRALRLPLTPGQGPLVLRFTGRPGDVTLEGWIIISPRS